LFQYENGVNTVTLMKAKTNISEWIFLPVSNESIISAWNFLRLHHFDHWRRFRELSLTAVGNRLSESLTDGPPSAWKVISSILRPFYIKILLRLLWGARAEEGESKQRSCHCNECPWHHGTSRINPVLTCTIPDIGYDASYLRQWEKDNAYITAYVGVTWIHRVSQ
jgi:hypothetical protein